MNRFHHLITAVGITAAFLTSGCGSRVDHEAVLKAHSLPHATSVARSASDSTVQPIADAPSAQQEGASPAAPSGTGSQDVDEVSAQPGESPGSVLDDGTVDDQRIHLRLNTQPACVLPGERMMVTIETEARAELTMVVGYSDGRPHGQMGFARADEHGLFVWGWLVTPDVPPGGATVLVQSWSEDGARGGHETDHFTVESSGGRC